MNVIELCPFTRNVLSKWQKLIDSTDASYSYADPDDTCLLYTSDAADDMQCVDLGGRRIIKKVWV
mgnify:CR=1 FL=1